MISAKHTRGRALAASRLIALLALLLVAAPAPALEDSAMEEEGSAWDVPLQAFDLVLLRPVGLVSVVAGAVFYTFAGPIGAAYGQAGALWKLYVVDNFDFTFRRPIGDFESESL